MARICFETSILQVRKILVGEEEEEEKEELEDATWSGSVCSVCVSLCGPGRGQRGV